MSLPLVAAQAPSCNGWTTTVLLLLLLLRSSSIRYEAKTGGGHERPRVQRTTTIPKESTKARRGPLLPCRRQSDRKHGADYRSINVCAEPSADFAAAVYLVTVVLSSAVF
ncbi:unnamed protein product [Soboliphyme baturini]|uniref:Secreted protein n=1 Tax=Soboliphyme baturini TaxID=241478 RepID=A0A183J1R9_9BILA|nr:unnamed protein product [Soboliphyme baturini]